MSDAITESGPLLGDVRQLIERARHRTATAVNSELVTLYWHIGQRIKTALLNDERAAYGQHVMADLGRTLSAEYGRGFSRSNLHRMVQFAERFPDEQIFAALRRQLSWTHFRELVAIDEPLKREFYAELCRVERWSTRTLTAKVNGMLFERTAIAKRPEAVIAQTLDELRTSGTLTPDLVFRDPYLLDSIALAQQQLSTEGIRRR